MISFDLDHFKQINTIIERDSKDATYKFALLRGAIEISQEYSHLKQESESGERVVFPLGLLVEKWLLYYYPLIDCDKFIPQKNGESESSHYKIAFRNTFRRLTEYYTQHGGFSVFYNDYRNGSIPDGISPVFKDLITELRTTITAMPMKHLGYSVYHQHYSLFKDEGGRQRIPSHTSMSQELLIRNLGYFSFPKELYAVFQYLGSFISGEDSLLYQWAEFTHSASNGTIPVESVLEKLRTFPVTEHNVQPARALYEDVYQKNGVLDCAWSGRPIRDLSSLHIDHVIPFSVWKNNDLWNLMPSSQRVNADKKDRVPTPEFIQQRSEAISTYWVEMCRAYPERFNRELRVSLIGITEPVSKWKEVALQQLKERCNYLINVRGFDGWSL